MDELIELQEEGMEVVNPEMRKEWVKYCDLLCNKLGLGELGLEIIEDVIETLRLLKENDMEAKQIVDKVGRSWNTRITSTILLAAIEKFCVRGEQFKKDILDCSANSVDLDYKFKNKR